MERRTFSYQSNPSSSQGIELVLPRGRKVRVSGAAVPSFGGHQGSASVSDEIAEEESFVISMPSSSTDNDFERLRSYSRVEASLADLAKMQTSTQHQLAQLAFEVADLRAQIALSQDSGGAEGYIESHFSLPSLEARLGLAEATRQLSEMAEILDVTSDLGISSPAICAAAERALGYNDHYARAAGARALAVGNPAMATVLLPDLIAAEKNETARAIMEAALRSASD